MFQSSNSSEYIIEMEQWRKFLERTMTDEWWWRSDVVRWVWLAVLAVVVVGGLMGNAAVCLVVGSARARSAVDLYLLDLAATDLVVSLALLFEVHEQLSPASYYFGRLECKLQFFLVVLLWNNGILVMTALAVERYVAVWHPMLLKRSRTGRRVRAVIAVTWVVAAAETTPELWMVELMKTQQWSVCMTVPRRGYRNASGLLALLTFVLPLLVMTLVYGMIALKLRRSDRAGSRGHIFNYHKNGRKVNKLIVALTASFLVCWVPFFSLRILTFVMDIQQLDKSIMSWWKLMFTVAMFTSWFSVVLNPLLFSLMSTKFRTAIKTFWQLKSNKLRTLNET